MPVEISVTMPRITTLCPESKPAFGAVTVV